MCVAVPSTGAGHGSALRSTLPDGSLRQLVKCHDQRHESLREALGQDRADLGWVDLADDVGDEQLVAGGALAHDGHGRLHPRDVVQLAVDLAELDPPAADLDLVVATADEHKTVGRLADDVAGAIGALPAQRWNRRKALRVEHGIEISGDADSRDHKLARLAERGPAHHRRRGPPSPSRRAAGRS